MEAWPSLAVKPALSDPGWNYLVLLIAAVFQGVSWRISWQALKRHRQKGEGVWRSLQRDMDVLVFTVFIGDSAALVGVVIAGLGVTLSHALNNPYFGSAASLLIGCVLILSAVLLAQKSVSLLVGVGLDRYQIEQLRKILAADPAVEDVGHLQTMRLRLNSVLLTAAMRFQHQRNLVEVEQAIARLEGAIKQAYPTIHRLYLESGALKNVVHSVGALPEKLPTLAPPSA